MTLGKQRIYLLTCGAAMLLVLAILFAVSEAAFAQTAAETVIYRFRETNDGDYPLSGVVADKDGDLYGTTLGGGSTACNFGCGTVFELVPSLKDPKAWRETVLYSFQGGSTDGASPVGTLTFDKSGNLYGTTVDGGTGGLGTVFELSPPATPVGAWTETVLYSFSADGSHGRNPSAGLVIDPYGRLYGTTPQGGSTKHCHVFGCGTIFELSPPATTGGAWTQKVIHRFYDGEDTSMSPSCTLAIDRSGSLYGTIESETLGFNPLVFRLVRNHGWSMEILYSFPEGATGDIAGVIIDNAGNLFGGSWGGGTDNFGEIFELSPPATAGDPWTKSSLYSFTGGANGIAPRSTLLMNRGSLFGTTQYGGGAFGGGVAFEVDPPAATGGTWTETTLHVFDGAHGDGLETQMSRLILVKGKFYGTTEYGGQGSCVYEAGCGTVFGIAIRP